MNWVQKIVFWTKSRLAERTTQTALVGLLSVALSHLNIPPDIQPSLANFIVAFFFAVAVTEG